MARRSLPQLTSATGPKIFLQSPLLYLRRFGWWTCLAHMSRIGHSNRLRRHGLGGQRVVQHAVLVYASTVRKRVAPNYRFIRLDRDARDLAQHLAGGENLLADHASFVIESILTNAHRHHNFFQRRIPGSLANAIDCAFNLPRSDAIRLRANSLARPIIQVTRAIKAGCRRNSPFRSPRRNQNPVLFCMVFRGGYLSLENIVQQIDIEIANLTNARNVLAGLTDTSTATSTNGSRSRFTSASRARMAASQKVRWDKYRAANGQTAAKVQSKAAKPLRVMSASARKRISAAQKKRWAKVRAKKTA
jgi:hypothetical protein